MGVARTLLERAARVEVWKSNHCVANLSPEARQLWDQLREEQAENTKRRRRPDDDRGQQRAYRRRCALQEGREAGLMAYPACGEKRDPAAMRIRLAWIGSQMKRISACSGSKMSRKTSSALWDGVVQNLVHVRTPPVVAEVERRTGPDCASRVGRASGSMPPPAPRSGSGAAVEEKRPTKRAQQAHERLRFGVGGSRPFSGGSWPQPILVSLRHPRLRASQWRAQVPDSCGCAILAERVRGLRVWEAEATARTPEAGACRTAGGCRSYAVATPSLYQRGRHTGEICHVQIRTRAAPVDR